MPLKYITSFTREELRDNPEVLYVYADTFAGIPSNEQGKAVYGEPNAVGIPVKRSYGWEEADFLSDGDLGTWKSIVDPKLRRGYKLLKKGGLIVWPYGGIGIEAELCTKAPLIAEEIRLWIITFQSFGNVQIVDPPSILAGQSRQLA